MIRTFHAVTVGVAVLVCSPVRAERRPPRDDCVADASFMAFRQQVAAIVARRDGKALLALTADDVTTGLNDSTVGKAEFVKLWALDKPGVSAIWAELKPLVSAGYTQGCSIDQGVASIPFYPTNFPQGRDYWNTGVPIRPKVALRRQPSAGAPVVAMLSYDLVTAEGSFLKPWVKVRTDEGRTGYVAADDLRYGASSSVTFKKRAGRWMLTSLSGQS